MTGFRENPSEANNNFGKFDLYHQRDHTEDEWYAILRRLFGQRWFLGFMTPTEVSAQQRVFTQFSHGTCFVYLNRDGNIIMSHSSFNPLRARVTNRTAWFPDRGEAAWLFQDVKGNETSLLSHPLDRGKALIYRKEVNRRARMGVDLWTLAGIRAGIPKDIRLLVAKLIWDERHEWMV